MVFTCYSKVCMAHRSTTCPCIWFCHSYNTLYPIVNYCLAYFLAFHWCKSLEGSKLPQHLEIILDILFSATIMVFFSDISITTLPRSLQFLLDIALGHI